MPTYEGRHINKVSKNENRTISHDPTGFDGADVGAVANVGHAYGCGAAAAAAPAAAAAGALAARSGTVGATGGGTRGSVDRPLALGGLGARAAAGSGDAKLWLLLLEGSSWRGARCCVRSAARRCCTTREYPQRSRIGDTVHGPRPPIVCA